jgi:hypothetical protein
MYFLVLELSQILHFLAIFLCVELNRVVFPFTAPPDIST